ncbi:hypothetical protein [Providencia sp. 2024EL-00732]|uniref:hypothetical protein n=1 Tax=Providencia sp. 2024EL-00732 TaxID=3374242 RepID=UPI003758324F
MKRHELWRNEYRQHRYMEHLSDDELQTRTKDIISNMSTLTPKGQIGLHDINDTGIFWMIKWTHIVEEFGLRYGPYPNGFTSGFLKDVPIVNPTYPEIPASKKIIDQVDGLKEGYVYKFGKSTHLMPMFKYGRIRISPASFYNDPSLNKAIQDDELSFSVSRKSEQVIIKDNDNNDIPTYGNVIFHLKSNTNYYVHCFANKYTFREFDDFEADSCIIISNPRILFQKMMKACHKKISDYTGFVSPVKYLDPLICDPQDVNILFSKHFRYSYQNEVRAIWVPPSPIQDLEPLYIEIGCMDKYAKIIHL